MEYKDYIVTWEIDIRGVDARDAAEVALCIMRDVESGATTFRVADDAGEEVTVNLDKEDRDMNEPHEIADSLTWLDSLRVLYHIRLDLSREWEAWNIAYDCFQAALAESGYTRTAFKEQYAEAFLTEWRQSRGRREEK